MAITAAAPERRRRPTTGPIAHTADRRAAPAPRRLVRGRVSPCSWVASSIGAVLLHTRLAERQLEIDALERSVRGEQEQFDVLRAHAPSCGRRPGCRSRPARSACDRVCESEFIAVDPMVLAITIARTGELPVGDDDRGTVRQPECAARPVPPRQVAECERHREPAHPTLAAAHPSPAASAARRSPPQARARSGTTATAVARVVRHVAAGATATPTAGTPSRSRSAPHRRARRASIASRACRRSGAESSAPRRRRTGGASWFALGQPRASA